MAQTFQPDELVSRKQAQAGGSVRFIVDQFGTKNLGRGGKISRGHLFGVAHQLVEMYFWRGHKSSDAAPAFDEAFALQSSQSVARRHQADFVQFGKIAFGGYRIARPQLPGVNALTDDRLDALVSGNGGSNFTGHGHTSSM